MIKLWRRALPRRIHDEKGIFFKQAMFALRIEQEIQPIWDILHLKIKKQYDSEKCHTSS